MVGSEYIIEKRRQYSLYVLQQRALPHAADGLKNGARRVVWLARDGKSYKSATLAGMTMPIHPHASPEDTVSKLAAPYNNNIPLLKGDGSFGTLLRPNAYSAPRYTEVTISKFTKDVILRDIEIIPLHDNYDGTQQEPTHFLPLIPIVLLNPQEGIAVGFASLILSRPLINIINSQLEYLNKKPVSDAYPALIPTSSFCEEWINDRWIFYGSFERTNATSLRITNLPFGAPNYDKYMAYLTSLIENDSIVDYKDRSKNEFNIEVIFKRGALSKLSDDEIIKKLKLRTAVSENMNVVGFDGKTVLQTNYIELIEQFTEWRLGFYKIRYERLARLIQEDIQRCKDLLLAIRKNIGGVAKKTESRSELKVLLDAIGIINLDYIADLPVYRFTENEKKKTEEKLAEATKTLAKYNKLIKSPTERTNVYIQELTDILHSYKKGAYE